MCTSGSNKRRGCCILVWSSQKSSIVQDRLDPAKMYFPCSLDTVLTAEHYRDLCAKTLQTFVKPVKVNAEVMTELGRHVPTSSM